MKVRKEGGEVEWQRSSLVLHDNVIRWAVFIVQYGFTEQLFLIYLL